MAKRGRKAKDNKGYLDTNRDNATDYKIIQGNKITMEGVSGNIYAIPVDRQGNVGQGVLMKPGEEHEFEDAYQIIELPEQEIQKAQTGLGNSTNPRIRNLYNDLQRDYDPEGQQAYEDFINKYYQDEIVQGTILPEIPSQPTELDEWRYMIDRTRDPIASTLPENNPNLRGSTTRQMSPEQVAHINAINPSTRTMTPEQAQHLESISGSRPQLQSVLTSGLQPTTEMAQAWDPESYSIKNNLPELDTRINVQTEGEYGVEETQRINFNNPYGGVDIATAASTLGASFSYDGDRTGANTVRGISSGLKLLTGLGRNFMSGYAQNKANQRALDEANRDMRRSLTTTRSIQQGGDLSQQDIDNINQSLGFSLDNETTNTLFTHTTQIQHPNEINVDFGKYSDLNYFEQGPIQNGRRIIYNTDTNPMNYDDNRRNALEYLRQINGDIFEFQYRPSTTTPTNQVVSRQKGGNVKDTDMLTGAYSTGTTNEIPNVEVEQGEFIKDNQTGKVTEVIGKKHSQGGEKMNLEDHKVLSDYNKIGAEKAKKYRDEFDIKVKAKDTYSTVMDKVLKKVGYTKLVEEMEETIALTEKEREKDGHQPTSSINLQFLSGKINDLNKKMQPLEELKSRVFETLFEDQQGDKSQEELNEENNMQGGGQSVRTATGNNPREFTNPDEQRFTNENRFIAGTVNDENYLETMLNLLEEFPNEFRAHFDIVQEGNNIVDIVPINGEESVRQFQRDVNTHYEQQLQKADQIQDPQTRERIKQEISGLMFEKNRYGDFDGIIGDFTASRRNYRIDIDEINRNIESNLGPQPVEGRMPENNIGGTRNVLLPNQEILPPSSIQPTRLAEITPREAQAQLISPEAQIEEINRQAQTARREINTLPDSQRRAALADLNTRTQQAINQVFSQTNRANAQIQNQTEQFNTQQDLQAQQYNEAQGLGYEQRIVTARDNTERDIRNYFNALNRQNVANYNTIQSLNLMNAMYDNVQYDGAGNVINTGRPLSREEMLAAAGFFDVAQKEEEEENKTKSTKNTAKRGRKTK